MLRMIKLFSTITFLFLFQFTYAQDISGNWQGNLETPMGEVPIILKITQTDEDIFETLLVSPKQSSTEFPADTTFFRNDSLLVELEALEISYKGMLTTEGIKGEFKQATMTLPLQLKKGTAELSENKRLNRPQDPKPPYPYKVEEVNFLNMEADTIKLSGTLTLPNGIEKPPVVVLISGSGPQDRNEELLNHRPFLIIADYLSRNGIAVLRYDDRGVGQSEGTFKGATTLDFASDAAAAVTYLKTRSDVAKDKIGLAGHSEGGLIAPIVASIDNTIQFLIVLAGPGVNGKEVLISQINKAAELSKTPDSFIKMNTKFMNIILSEIYNQENPETMITTSIKKTKEYHNTLPDSVKTTIPFEQLEKQIKSFTNDPWMRNYIKTEPADFLAKVKVPVLVLQGGKDFQVVPEINLPAIEKVLKKTAQNKDVTIHTFENLNHLFQKAETGAASEYAKIEETFNPEALNLMTTWILKRF